MLTFNDILIAERIDPSNVVLVRHQDDRAPPDLKPYMLWRRGDPRLEEYQRIQSQQRFAVGELVASFVVTPRDETLFIGLYCVNGMGTVPQGRLDPISGVPVGGMHDYDMSFDSRLGPYVGKLIIEWGKGYRTWAQRASRNVKPVLEIRKGGVAEEPWPGFRAFACMVGEAHLLPPNWQSILQAVKGVYVLVDVATGEQYVGSATGVESLWGRLQDYARTGHGGNVELKARDARQFQFSVLEALTSSDGDVLLAENEWKRKLRTRETGLNAN